MSDWDKVSAAFDFIEAVTPYLAEMAERGDYQAKALLGQALEINEDQAA